MRKRGMYNVQCVSEIGVGIVGSIRSGIEDIADEVLASRVGWFAEMLVSSEG